MTETLTVTSSVLLRNLFDGLVDFVNNLFNFFDDFSGTASTWPRLFDDFIGYCLDWPLFNCGFFGFFDVILSLFLLQTIY